MSSDAMAFLAFSMHCFKIIIIYCVCVNMLEHFLQRLNQQ
ncbi:uncharacterized protein LOC108151877 [Drosophila miranda]|uniref:Uncharacterized protein n=1 Tax=Drosophila pseudoobscura pseudoobscura TaxID=46245 RepID=A0A6I8W7T9_DROPS|nr:uncharacterized protein LOC108151877 [Drosophila miranda]XP_026849317.1 uncharacterized protein LOC113566703 [Drosophila persimilis]XP_033238699.1 uncharacterized protein LOC117184563 [Drosophila pseudoobscura]